MPIWGSNLHQHRRIVCYSRVRTPVGQPQLYTSGTEGNPEFLHTPCSREVAPGTHWSKCTWERLSPMKAKWVLSLASASHYAAAKAFFNQLGIEPIGYIQWRDPPSRQPMP